jgi:mannose-1-phosphate guanylyltransferase
MSPDPHHFAIILAGGRGERFWPRSRRETPKQFLAILGEKTMLQQTYARIRPLFRPQNIIVLTNAEHVDVVRRQLPELPASNVFGEPTGRDTAPAVGLGAVIVGKRDPSAVMAVLPADAVIHDEKRFRQILSDALTVSAAQDVLVTIGLKPASPHTGYGYIHAGVKLSMGTQTEFHRARKFTEKPNLTVAKRYLRRSDYLWNSGMFVWSFASITAAFARHQPAMASVFFKLYEAAGTAKFRSVLKRVYPKLQKISVDYALMEHAKNIVVAKGTFDWDDLGSWTALEQHLARDLAGNIAHSAAELVETNDCIIVGDGTRLVAAVGLKDLVIVETKDVTLVCHKRHAQMVRELVKRLEKSPQRKKHL